MIIESIFLGLIEGLTEFIPVSSTGHLIAVSALLNIETMPTKVFEVVIQLGAILAICFYYRQRLTRLVLDAKHDKQARYVFWIILIAFLPAACLGVLCHQWIKAVLFSPLVVAINLVIGGMIIWFVEHFHLCPTKQKPKHTEFESLPRKTALGIGLLQMTALMPGVSRSGATIMGGVVMGLDRKTATEFSFFLAIPTMFGAALFDLYQNSDALSIEHIQQITIGFVSAFIAALLVIKLVITFIEKHGFKPFAYYRMVAGSLLLAWVLL